VKDKNDWTTSKIPEDILSELASLITDDAAISAFKTAALSDDVWERAKADPAEYFSSQGVEIPPDLEISFSDHHSRRPWPPLEPDLQLVVVRCWWVWGKVDPDDDPVPPFHFCLEVPESLLRYVSGFGT
jgi:hypothetical protein